MNSEAPRKDNRNRRYHGKKNFRRPQNSGHDENSAPDETPVAPAESYARPEQASPEPVAAGGQETEGAKERPQRKRNNRRGKRNNGRRDGQDQAIQAQPGETNTGEASLARKPEEPVATELQLPPAGNDTKPAVQGQQRQDRNRRGGRNNRDSDGQRRNQDQAQEKKFVPPVPLDIEENYIAQRIVSSVENYLTRELFVEDGSRICVGVSGGVDSIALLDILAIIAKKRNYFVVVAHGNHNLRGKSSGEDEHFVRQLARRYGFYFHHSTLHVKAHAEKYSQSIEHAARNLRYKFFERVSKESRADFLATAHSADDVAETFFLNLFRGAGLTGLSAIPPRRPLTKRTLVIRPLLPLRKTEIIEYARSRQLEWREDETNSLYLYTRNKIRHLMLPKIEDEFSPVVVAQINRSVRLLQGADEIIRERVEQIMPIVISEFANERCFLKISILEGLNDFMKGEIFEEVLKVKFKTQSAPFTTIERVIGLIESEPGSIAEISKQIQAIREREHIVILRRKNVSEKNLDIMKTGEFPLGDKTLVMSEVPRAQVKFSENPDIEYFDADLLPYRLIVRNWQHGDSFQPLGMSGTMKLSDFLTNEKLPSLERQGVLVMTTVSNQIVWVLGERIDERFKVTNETTRVIRAELKNNPAGANRQGQRKEQDTK